MFPLLSDYRVPMLKKGPGKLFILPLFFLSICAGYAQELKNIIAEFDGDKMKITYDLLCDNPDQKFTLLIYSSHNDYELKLANVIGDVGNNILPGRGKIITWYLLQELPASFDETIQLKLIASPAAAAVEPVARKMRFISPVENAKAKKGKLIQLRWEGTSIDNNYLLELYSGNVKKSDIVQTVKDQYYNWKIPKSTEKGKNYKIKLTNRGNTMEYVFSPVFEIKAGFPKALVAVPVVVVAGVVYFVIGSDHDNNGNGGNGGDELSDLPRPINPQ